VGDDAGRGLVEDVEGHCVADETAGIGFGDRACVGDFGKTGSASWGK
jgi:hypothetical protein